MLKRAFMAAAWLCIPAMIMAQQPPPPPQGPPGEVLSPKDQASVTFGEKKLTIDYSSPRVRGRQGKIYTKDGLISHDQDYPFWRAGADDATTLKSTNNFMIGDLMIPAGTYTLFVDISDPAQWTLVVSKDVGEWGLDYKKTKDFGRVKMKMAKPAATVENLKWVIKPTMGTEGTIMLEWENESGSVPLMMH